VQRRVDELQSSGKVSGNERGRQSQHAKPRSGECAVATRISPAPERVMRAVNFHDQVRVGSEEVHDVALQHDLPPKPHTELRSAKRRPKHTLRLRRRDAHAMRVSRELPLLAKLAV
jgi:hypothetical protein